MIEKGYYQSGGLNLYVNPVVDDGGLIHSVNMDSFPLGAKTKRPGYTTLQGTADGEEVRNLFHWVEPVNNELYLYRVSDNKIYYSKEGTQNWQIANNGTIDSSAYVGHAEYANVLILGDAVTNTRHTTNGTAFTNTTLAPKSNKFAEFQGRIYAGGTANTLFFSSANDATDWSTTSPSDSSSLEVPGAGYINSVINAQDKIVVTKTQGGMRKWDGYALIDMSTQQGCKSRFSQDQSENYWFWTNSEGLYGFGGGRPELLSNAVQRYFYNSNDNGISGSALTNMKAAVHRYQYYATMGTITDDLTDKTIENAILKYDFQKNEFLTYKFNDYPTALHSYKDTNGQAHLIFGDETGQVYEFGGTAKSDNGQPIYSELMYVFNLDEVDKDKSWKWIDMFFNPGCQAKVQVGYADTFTKNRIEWYEIGSVQDGVIGARFPSGKKGARSKLLFVRIYENSSNAPWTYYGCSIEAEINPR